MQRRETPALGPNSGLEVFVTDIPSAGLSPLKEARNTISQSAMKEATTSIVNKLSDILEHKLLILMESSWEPISPTTLIMDITTDLNGTKMRHSVTFKLLTQSSMNYTEAIPWKISDSGMGSQLRMNKHFWKLQGLMVLIRRKASGDFRDDMLASMGNKTLRPL